MNLIHKAHPKTVIIAHLILRFLLISAQRVPKRVVSQFEFLKRFLYLTGEAFLSILDVCLKTLKDPQTLTNLLNL